MSEITGNSRSGEQGAGSGKGEDTGLRASGPALGNLGVVFRRVLRATEAPAWKLPG